MVRLLSRRELSIVARFYNVCASETEIKANRQLLVTGERQQRLDMDERASVYSYGVVDRAGLFSGEVKKINIETRRSTTLKQRVILVQGPC
jgi:hypothetical protein